MGKRGSVKKKAHKKERERERNSSIRACLFLEREQKAWNEKKVRNERQVKSKKGMCSIYFYIYWDKNFRPKQFCGRYNLVQVFCSQVGG